MRLYGSVCVAMLCFCLPVCVILIIYELEVLPLISVETRTRGAAVIITFLTTVCKGDRGCVASHMLLITVAHQRIVNKCSEHLHPSVGALLESASSRSANN